MLILFSNVLFAQSPSGVAFNWNNSVGCQLFGEIRDPDKDPVLIDDIIDGQCITVCNESTVTYTLSGNLAANPNTTWTVVGGIASAQSNTSCVVNWQGLGDGSITFTTTSLTGIVTKTICFTKVKSPKAIFTVAQYNPYASASGCSLQTIYFTNLSIPNGGSGLYSYYWDFDDDSTNPISTSTAFAPTHIYLQDATYHVTLTVTNSCGCSDTFTQEIKVGNIGFDISCPSVVCDGQTTEYSLPFDGVNICQNNYNWNVTGGSFTDLHNGSVKVTWDQVGPTGFGYVTFNPANCNLSCGDPTSIRIPVIQSVGTITGNATTCLNNQERYVLPQWPTTDFTWTIVGNVNENLAHVYLTDQRNEIIIQPLVSGDLTLRCTYQNTLLHCGGTAEFVIHVVNVMAINGPSSLCQSTTGNYNIPTGESTSWTLKNSASVIVGSSPSSNTFSFNFATAGTYTLTIGGSSGCPSSAKTITVIPTPTTPLVLNPTLVVCPNAPYTYTIAGANPGAQYNWQVTDGTFIGSNTGSSVVIQFGLAATHTLTVNNQTTSTPVCSSPNTVLMITKQLILADISADFGAVCPNNNYTYSAINAGSSPETPYNNGDTYTWTITPSYLGSITTGQGTHTINVLWNNVTVSGVPATLQCIIQKCTVSLPFSKNIIIQPVVAIAITAPASICSGNPPATFTITSANGVTLSPTTQVTWNFGDGNTATTTGLSTTHPYNNTTTANISYNVTASITNPNGCLGNAISPVKVISILPAPSVGISIHSGGNTFCPITQTINTVLSATATTGSNIKWYRTGNSSTFLGQNPLYSVAPNAYGSYYFTATNAAGCTSVSEFIFVVSDCSVPNNCIASPNITNTSSIGCIAPTTTSNCNCGIINLTGTATGAVVGSESWTIVSPSVNLTGYTGSSIGTANAQLEPGEYHTFKVANYICSNTGAPQPYTEYKKVIVPYYADFAYTVLCNGSNYNIALVDKSPYFTPVPLASRTFNYYTGPSATGSSWTLVGSTRNYTITNIPAGNYYIRLVITGTLNNFVQTPCEKIIQVNIAPSVVQTITVAPISCHDTPVQFDVSPFVLTDTYLWTFDNGATNTLRNPKRVFDSPGLKTVTVVIKNKYGCVKAILSTPVNIPDKCFNGTVTTTPDPPSVCAGNSITMQYTPSGPECGVVSYTWMNANVPMGLSTPTISVNSTGFYWVKVTSANNCTYGTPNRVTPVFKALPTLDITPIPTYCNGVDIPLSITTNATTIAWTIDNVLFPIFANQSNIVIPASLGFAPISHTISVTVTSADGCSKTATATLVIANTPQIPDLSMSLLSCNPYLVQITATNSTGNYNWSNGISGTNTITVSDGGPYMLTVSAGGCSISNQIDVPKNLDDYFWIFPSGCYTACDTNLGSLIGPSVVPLPAWEWDLDHNGLVGGTGAVAPLPLNDTGIYNLSLNNGLCSKESNDLNYTLATCQNCAITTQIEKIEAGITPYCSFTLELIINNSSPTTPLPITISNPSNNVLVSPSSFTASPGLNPFVVLTIIPINGFNGGPTTLLVSGFDIRHNEICTTEIPLELPACVNTDKMELITVADTNDLLIAPNPSKGITTISFTNATAPQLVVYDLLGKEMAHYSAIETKGEWQLDTSSIAAGIYLVVMKDANGILMQKKLIVE